MAFFAPMPDAGVGACFPLRFGGKTSAVAGGPIDAEVEVVTLKRDAAQSIAASVVPLRNCAVMSVKPVGPETKTSPPYGTGGCCHTHARHREGLPVRGEPGDGWPDGSQSSAGGY